MYIHATILFRKGIFKNSTWISFFSLLQKSFAEKLRLWKEENATLTQKSCDELLKKLKGEHLDPVFERVRGPDGAKVKYSEIMDAWNKIKAGFNAKAVGTLDVRADAFFKFNQVN